MRHSSSFWCWSGERPQLGAQQASQVAVVVGKNQSPLEQGGRIIRQDPDGEPSKQAEGSIKQTDDPACKVSSDSVAGNGELGDDPLRSGESVGKKTVDQ